MRCAARVIAVCLLVFLSIRVSADTLTGKVGRVVDGDTLYVLDANYKEHKIRLAGIDAPERRQAYGLASRKHLASIVAGQQVTVEYQKRDRYGRIVGKVLGPHRKRNEKVIPPSPLYIKAGGLVTGSCKAFHELVNTLS